TNYEQGLSAISIPANALTVIIIGWQEQYISGTVQVGSAPPYTYIAPIEISGPDVLYNHPFKSAQDLPGPGDPVVGYSLLDEYKRQNPWYDPGKGTNGSGYSAVTVTNNTGDSHDIDLYLIDKSGDDAVATPYGTLSHGESKSISLDYDQHDYEVVAV